MPKIGEIYKVRIKFDDKDDFKIRPCIIINIKNNYYTIVEITTKKYKKYYDRFKIPIEYWQEAHLDQVSYFKTNKIHQVSRNVLYQYIGCVNANDLEKCKEEVINTITALRSKI